MSEMAAATETPTAAPAEAERGVRIRPITVAEYYRMGDVGIIGPDERVELLDGKLIAMPPVGPDHGYSVDSLSASFMRRFGGRAWISVQRPIALDDRSEPQPDVTLSKLPAEKYRRTHPRPADILLLVEVAQSSLAYDSGSKLCAYAQRGIEEYWIVNLVDERLDVYRDPEGERYRVHLIAKRGEVVEPLAFPGEAVVVDEFLPPPQ